VTLGGWVFMILSWVIILSMTIFCFTMVFKKGLGGENSKKRRTE
jgi:hypothetical protein